jgi:hypothetical protein
MNKKLKIYNKDGSTTEVEPVPSWYERMKKIENYTTTEKRKKHSRGDWLKEFTINGQIM